MSQPDPPVPHLLRKAADESQASLTRQRIPVEAELSAGMTVDRFQLVEFIGEGGMGQAWKAVDPRRKDEKHNGFVALKFLKPEEQQNEAARQRSREAFRAISRLQHSNICPVYDLIDDRQFGSFQVMKYVDGVTLRKCWKNKTDGNSSHNSHRVAEIVNEVAAALQEAHDQGVLHRDIKPDNILIERGGRIQLIDFGLASEMQEEIHESKGLTAGGGTPAYMAPEQILEEKQSAATDQFSLAVVAWELLTGLRPYPQKIPGLLLQSMLHNDLPKTHGLAAGVLQVLQKALHAERKERFATVRQFAAKLQEAISASAAVSTPLERSKSVPATLRAPRVHDMESSGNQSSPSGRIPPKGSTKQPPISRRGFWLGAGALATATWFTLKEILKVDEGVPDSPVAGSDVIPVRGAEPAVPKSTSPPAESAPGAVPEVLQAPFDGRSAISAQDAWAVYLRTEAEVMNSLRMRFRLIPPGEFLMGSPELEMARGDDEFRHKVVITQPKLLGVCPVTQAEWTRIMGSNPSRFREIEGQDTSRFPVEQVSWNDIQDFISRLNSDFPLSGWRYRLPSEAEWEYACRAGTTTAFSFGSELNGVEANCDGNVPYGAKTPGPCLTRPSEVGSYAANSFGLYDMHGNVWEWCSDSFQADYYLQSPAEDPDGPDHAVSRVVRGGAWNGFAVVCRSALRNFQDPVYRDFSTGFRLLCDKV